MKGFWTAGCPGVSVAAFGWNAFGPRTPGLEKALG